MNPDQNEFLDGEKFASPQELSFKEILLRQLRRAGDAGCAEMHGGFERERLTIQAGFRITEKVWVPDESEVFYNHVRVLAALCRPHFDKKTETEEASFRERVGACESRVEKTALVVEYYAALNRFIKSQNYFEGGDIDDQ